ncbi:ComEC/Rec2 family competence protein [uncultured Clostridium sp.]|uniref:ComEC/Rec2 family competence protein n=1 Tax=uncultured Clostridium sp. TaxID=59620 RepID=UPI0025D29067|nr:ComEC/Rec2 family competence protein [uncultured Clostridium sp.]
MFHKRLEEVNNPIIYIFSAVAVSCICYGIYNDFRGLSILIGALFFIYIFFYFGIEFDIFIAVFFIVGLYINTAYYKIIYNIDNAVRIIEINNYNIIGKVDGKNIILDSRYDFSEGKKYHIKGTVSDSRDTYEGVCGILKPYEIYPLEDDFLSRMYQFKKNIFYALKENIGERRAGLITSMAFGGSKNIDSEDKDDMKNYGIIHSICVSGLHVAIVYGFLKYFLGNKIGLIFCALYVMFTGSNYASIRAFVMLSSVEGAKLFKRNNNSLSALSLSALILLIYKPYSIMEISFHLSYLATLGIILLNRNINCKLYKFPDKLRDNLSVTLSAQAFTFPYMIIVFRDFSLNFILGNLLLIPFVNILVILGNMLIPVYNIPCIFDFISYICMYIIRLMDLVISKMNMYSLPMFYGNEYTAFFYLWLIISYYFMKKGYKKMIYLPVISVFVIAISMYSPVLNIKYYREGALLVSYKGDRILVSTKKEIDMDRLSKAANSTESYKIEKSINFKGQCSLRVLKNDYILKVRNKEILLKMSSNKNYYGDYDIISFKDGPVNGVYIVDDKLIEICS